MHPFLFGFWVCFGPNLLIIFILTWLGKMGNQAPGWLIYLEIALWILPFLGFVLILYKTRRKRSVEFRGRIGVRQFRGGAFGVICSVAMTLAMQYREQISASLNL
ncbi:MAG: hypothetical protein AAGK14_09065 [Verrucomicrobiota bacterium]